MYPVADDTERDDDAMATQYIWSGLMCVLLFAMLKWLSSVGDAWASARLRVLLPTTAADVFVTLGPDVGQIFIEQLARIELGFEILSVCATSYRVVYLFITVVCTCIYMAPSIVE